MKKLSTGIPGLDTLFHGGIQLKNPNKDDGKNGGLIIALRGAKGCNKTLLSMQLMQGISCALEKYQPLFISLNKSKEDLIDMYYDVFISRLLNAFCEIESTKQKITSDEQLKSLRRNVQMVLGELFVSAKKEEHIDYTIINKIADRVVYYNTRTNNLHFRRVQNDTSKKGCYILGNYGDDTNNVLYERNISPNAEIINKALDEINLLINHNSDYLYIQNMLSIEYWNNDNKGKALVKLQNIINNLGLGKLNESCLVIDGFSALNTKELTEIPYTEFENLLRRHTDVSLLVFDERTEAIINADIVIDMRKTEASDEEYVYHELQISKSVFQTAALGWHQYKKRDTGIDVFPSIHMLLSKRNYLPYKLLTMQNSVLQETYEEYLTYTDCFRIANNVALQNEDEITKYYESKEIREYDILRSIAHSCNATENVGDFSEVIWGDIVNKNNYLVHGWHDHLPSTAIIGNPNSHKRQFAIAGAFHAAKSGEHTIFVLFDKNEADMRRRMRCPSLNVKNAKWECFSEQTMCSHCEHLSNKDCGIRDCYECYKYIHFFQIRMGCISAEEFFDALLKQIRYYNNLSEGKPCHIVIDDLQKIDYSFPFLRKTPLFLSALITLCRQNFAELKIICDKRANLVGELCSLSDNVLCIYRDEADIDNIIVYIERNFGGIHSSGLAKFIITVNEDLFICNDSGFFINENNITVHKVGSMKEYWRKTRNIVLKDKKNK